MVIVALDHVPQCFSASDGQTISALIRRELRSGRDVVVSLAGVDDIPSSFANGAFASLLDEFALAQVQSRLRIADASAQAADMIRRCMNNGERRKQKHYA